jgi:hypothetical protein
LGDDVLETRNPKLKNLELEGARFPGTPIIGEQKRTMIRQGRRECVEDVRIKAKIPFGVAIESIKLAKSW